MRKHASGTWLSDCGLSPIPPAKVTGRADMRAVSMLTVQGRDGGQTKKLAGEDAVASEYCCRTEIRSATREPKLAVRAYAHSTFGLLTVAVYWVSAGYAVGYSPAKQTPPWLAPGACLLILPSLSTHAQQG